MREITNPNKDQKEITVTLPNGKMQAFRVANNGRVYIKGSPQYWDTDQFAVALQKMRDAGTAITEKNLL